MYTFNMQYIHYTVGSHVVGWLVKLFWHRMLLGGQARSYRTTDGHISGTSFHTQNRWWRRYLRCHRPNRPPAIADACGSNLRQDQVRRASDDLDAHSLFSSSGWAISRAVMDFLTSPPLHLLRSLRCLPSPHLPSAMLLHSYC